MNAHIFRGFTLLVLYFFVLISSSPAADKKQSKPEQKSFEILHYEPLPPMTLQRSAHDSGDEQTDPPSWNWSFEAFGKTFHAHLEPNDRLIARLPSEQRKNLTSHYSLYRGVLEGVNDSWVRLTNINGTWSGMIWDGEEIYVIDPMTMIAASLQITPSEEQSAHGIYRLSDTRDLEKASCGLGEQGVPAKPITDYQSLLDELQQVVRLEQKAHPRTLIWPLLPMSNSHKNNKAWELKQMLQSLPA